MNAILFIQTQRRYFRRTQLHRWAVRRAGKALGVSFWRRWKHDWTKFLPSEWKYTSAYFGLPHALRREEDFQYLKEHIFPLHKARNDHHTEYWNGKPMSKAAMDEMIADWWAAGYVYDNGNPDVLRYYLRNRDKLGIHKDNIDYVEFRIMTIHYHQMYRPETLFPKELSWIQRIRKQLRR